MQVFKKYYIVLILVITNTGKGNTTNLILFIYSEISKKYFCRLVLRCRQEARNRFAQLRSDVLVKLELLDNKHIQDVVWQLQRFVSSLAIYHSQILDLLNENKLFPIEVDLAKSALEYDNVNQVSFTSYVLLNNFLKQYKNFILSNYRIFLKMRMKHLMLKLRIPNFQTFL